MSLRGGCSGKTFKTDGRTKQKERISDFKNYCVAGDLQVLRYQPPATGVFFGWEAGSWLRLTKTNWGSEGVQRDKKAYPQGLKSASRNKNVPQRLKPRCKQSTIGTAEAVPLSKT
jgi:hypothetical protein